ncbi:hypothetical protein QFC19_007977 [Naganishia cerealis]|uniref:Uncharacterized protein n=1 Tax=Naganishia cerealis TaxID=610337 RepID=A0ACC2V5A3_9TREE|nr:hypothetical protein QFC19_007977 [Naganishia cerealis]
MLLPAYDSHGRLYYPQYEDPPSVEKPKVQDRTVQALPRSTQCKTRSFSPCIDDTLNAFSVPRNKQPSMVVKQPKSLYFSQSNELPKPALSPIPRWTGRSSGEKRGRNRNEVDGRVERSRSRDIAGLAPKPRDKKDKERDANYRNCDDTHVSVVEAPLVTPPSLDPATASDYSAFTDIITPDSTYGAESRPHSYVSSSFKPTKQFFASANTSSASLLSQTAPSPSSRKYRRSSLFPPDGPEEYPVRGLCPHLQVLLMNGENRVPPQSRTERSRSGRPINCALFPATSPPLMPLDECDPLVTEIRSALESDISLQTVMDSSYLALVPRLLPNRTRQLSSSQPRAFISYLSFVSSSAFKVFSGQSSSSRELECECCKPSTSCVKMSDVDDWIDSPSSIRQYRPPARRRADGTTLRKWCLEWQMVVNGKVDGVKARRESTPPVERHTREWKRGRERWGCGCVHHGFD